MSGGKSPRRKGDRAERALVRFLQDRGFAAERVPLSGAAGGSYLGDLTIPLLGVDRVAEVKVRAHGFQQLYGWLARARPADSVRADRSEPLVILPLKLAAEIVGEGQVAMSNRLGAPPTRHRGCRLRGHGPVQRTRRAIIPARRTGRPAGDRQAAGGGHELYVAAIASNLVGRHGNDEVHALIAGGLRPMTEPETWKRAPLVRDRNEWGAGYSYRER